MLNFAAGKYFLNKCLQKYGIIVSTKGKGVFAMGIADKRNIIRLTNDYIVQQKVYILPVTAERLRALLSKQGFKLWSYVEGKDIIDKYDLHGELKYDAFTISGDLNVVFYNDELSVSQRLFSIAHELGHIVLGHVPQGIRNKNNKIKNEQELEADAFAYQLLAPICVLKHFNIDTVNKIQTETLLDEKAAQIVAKRLNTIDDTYKQELIVRKINKQKRKRTLTVITVIAFILILIAGIYFIINSSLNNVSNQHVYITPTGEKYHKEGCYHLYSDNHLKEDVTMIPLSECISKGYDACSNCFQ